VWVFIDSVSPDFTDDPRSRSSGSEVSYTDSGIPATANVTPSPVDFDTNDDAESQSKKVIPPENKTGY